MSGNGIILGRESTSTPFGFDNPQPINGELIRYEGEAPLAIIAPTGAGKGRDLLLPLLLTTPNPVVVLDIKAELVAVAARARREMGHRVVVLDPFGISGMPSDRIDPFELFELPGSLLECDSEMLASLLNQGHGVEEDPFWDDTGSSLIAGLIAMSATLKEPDYPGLAFLRKHLFSDDAVYSIAVLLDTCGNRCEFANRELAGFLQHADNQTRPCVLATARTFMRALNAPQVAACLENATFSLKDVMDGKPLDVFIVMPPDKIHSHAGLLRLLVGTLMTAITRRTEIPEHRTIMVIDESAQLGKEFAPLLTAATLMRGYGLQLVTAWQDLAQVKSRYKSDWETILNNSGAVICFGMGHYKAAKDAAEFLGLEPSELLRMKPDEAALAVRGEGTRKIRRTNYLTDGMFEGLADQNPFFRRRSGIGR
ncbi:type IV secretory system conjugative DNA transfer family protein [Tundrisphaera sp. TA3]|uniref:type IV secretory system conjugative DNA transfer family protein n=1 Tax=Tundrisphaera sp. TA3 TaxID=3435775 RepID=UPI003EB83623